MKKNKLLSDRLRNPSNTRTFTICPTVADILHVPTAFFSEVIEESGMKPWPV